MTSCQKSDAPGSPGIKSAMLGWPGTSSIGIGALGAEAEGIFTLFGILFFLLSVAMIGIGLIGEYVGRTYQVVRARQRYHVREILETK